MTIRLAGGDFVFLVQVTERIERSASILVAAADEQEAKEHAAELAAGAPDSAWNVEDSDTELACADVDVERPGEEVWVGGEDGRSVPWEELDR